MVETSPGEYERLVHAISQEAAEDFRQAAGDVDEQRRACVRYFRRGHAAGLSHAELIDFLGVSTPSVLDTAGYSNDDSQRVMDTLVHISSDEIDGV